MTYTNYLKTTIANTIYTTVFVCVLLVTSSNIAYAGKTCGVVTTTVFGVTGTYFPSCPGSQVCMPVPGNSTSKECVEVNNVFPRLFTPISNILTGVAVISGFFLLVIAGYKIMTSQGNPQNLQEGKDMLGAVIPGLIFVLIASSILRVLIKVLISGGTTNPF